MCIHITALIVQEGQAGEGLQIVCFFRTIANGGAFIIPLLFGDLMPCHGSVFRNGPNSGRLQDGLIDALHVPFLNLWSGHYLST